MSDYRKESRARWGEAAQGWEAHAEQLRRVTMPVSTWMVDAIGPQPGYTLLELAAGPGETGFLAAEMIRPGGTLISSDIAPEMLSAAQRRAEELGLDNVRFKQIDADSSIDIEAATIDNTDFRRVLFTRQHLQLTVMSIPPGERVGWEMHDHLDQFLRIESGTGRLMLGRTGDEATEEVAVTDDWAMIIPAGTWHDVVNEGEEPLKLYSVYGPPDHPDGTVHRTKADAEAAEEEEPSEHDHHAEPPDEE